MTDYPDGHEPPTTQDPILRNMISGERGNRIAELEAEIARLTSERDRAVALVRDVAAAYIEWRFDWDIVMPGRLLSAMAACREFVADEPPKGEKAMTIKPKKTFRFAINGEDVKIQPVETDTMAQVRDRVLKDSHNTGRPSTEWEIRDDRGVWVDPETRVSARADKEWFFLTIKAAFGGEG